MRSEMPNGIAQNWDRRCAAIAGYRNRYGSWPTRLRLPKGSLEHIFKEETLVKIGKRIRLEYDGSPFIAEDDQGRSYHYGQEGFKAGTDILRMTGWRSNQIVK